MDSTLVQDVYSNIVRLANELDLPSDEFSESELKNPFFAWLAANVSKENILTSDEIIFAKCHPPVNGEVLDSSGDGAFGLQDELIPTYSEDDISRIKKHIKKLELKLDSSNSLNDNLRFEINKAETTIKRLKLNIGMLKKSNRQTEEDYLSKCRECSTVLEKLLKRMEGFLKSFDSNFTQELFETYRKVSDEYGEKIENLVKATNTCGDSLELPLGIPVKNLFDVIIQRCFRSTDSDVTIEGSNTLGAVEVVTERLMNQREEMEKVRKLIAQWDLWSRIFVQVVLLVKLKMNIMEDLLEQCRQLKSSSEECLNSFRFSEKEEIPLFTEEKWVENMMECYSAFNLTEKPNFVQDLLPPLKKLVEKFKNAFTDVETVLEKQQLSLSKCLLSVNANIQDVIKQHPSRIEMDTLAGYRQKIDELSKYLEELDFSLIRKESNEEKFMNILLRTICDKESLISEILKKEQA